MERPLDDAAMLHFIRDSLFRSDSPLHHEFSTSLEKFIAEPIASRESEWFPCLSRDLHSCSQKLADTQAKVIELEQRIDVLQATAASATAATEQRVDVLQATAASATAATGQRIDTLQSSTENATQAAANELRRVEHELSQCYALSTNLYELRVHHLRTTSSFRNHNNNSFRNHRLLRIPTNLTLHNNHSHSGLPSNHYPSS